MIELILFLIGILIGAGGVLLHTRSLNRRNLFYFDTGDALYLWFHSLFEKKDLPF